MATQQPQPTACGPECAAHLKQKMFAAAMNARPAPVVAQNQALLDASKNQPLPQRLRGELPRVERVPYLPPPSPAYATKFAGGF
jgi:hypothetical protein